MKNMTLPEFLVRVSDQSIHVQGHRVNLEHLIWYYNQGYSVEMLLEQFPTLSLSTIHKVIAFYLDNKKEMDEYVSKSQEEMDRQVASASKRLDTAELRRRFEARRKTGS